MAGPLEALFAGQMATQPSVLDRLMSETIVPRQPQNTEGIERLIGTPVDWSGVATRGRDDTSMSPVNMAMGLIGGPSLRGIRAYHGSPHKFDKFSMDRIGTGEGAQAYGHGLYFAENERVARGYRDALKKDMFYTPGGQMFDPQSQLQHMNVRVAARNNGPDLDATIARAQELLPRASEQTRPMIEHDLAVLRGLKEAGGISQNPGHMYEVNIRANPEQFLDWDRPLSQQSSRIQEATRPLVENQIQRVEKLPWSPLEKNDARAALLSGDVSGAELYRANFGHGPAPPLREAGIPGIKYLDQGSRTAGQGSSNYVVFDDSIIDILKRYGIMGGAVSPLATLMQENPQ